MAILSVVSDNSHTMPAAHLSRRELRERRERLNIVAHSGGRMLPVPVSVFEPTSQMQAAIARPAAHQVSDFVSPGLRAVGPSASPTGRQLHIPMTAHDNYIIDREE